MLSKEKLMKILLDTHVYLWWLAQSPRLTESAMRRIETAEEVHVSAASLWEAAIKTATGKLEADIDELRLEIAANDFLELPITMEHAVTCSKLPFLHKDPFDRILIAQAVSEPLRLMTAERRLADYTSLVELV